MNKIGFIFLLGVAFAACTTANSENRGSVVNETAQQPQTKVEVLSAEAFAEKLKNPQMQVVDVRTPGEVAGGKIANAVNIDYNSTSFEELAAKLDRDKPVAVYCKVGGRSSRAVQVFEELGFKEIYELDGGIISWKASKLPVEQ